MDGRFGRSLARLHGVSAARLSDCLGSYQFDAQPPVKDIDLMVDRGVSLEGAEGVFRSGTVAISWPSASLACVARGGIFTVGAERFIVDDTVADDGHYLTAICTVMR
ncbi:hypothetical protein AX279_19725 [Pseudomonas sp. J237]|nr:hypothetical protein AX279_19725 [Pseudomonas sp. J237]